MVSLDKAVVAKMRGFEILVDPDLALEFRKGKPGSVDNILAVRDVFSDARKGERPAEEDLVKAFGTADTSTIAEVILKQGDIQLTTEQRRKLVEEKRKAVAAIISKQGIDPKTKLPHPPQRILNAMEEAHVSLDPFRPADQQVEDTLKKIEPVIPISLERIQIAVKVPMEHAGKASSSVRTFATVKSEEWKGDGWYALLEIPAGMQSDIYTKINDLTHGQAEVKVVEK